MRCFTLPVWTPFTPKVKITHKSGAGKMFQIMDEKTHCLGTNRKSEHTFCQFRDIDLIISTTSQADVEFIQSKTSTTKGDDQEEMTSRRDRVDRSRSCLQEYRFPL
jgi:hypothetical protein